MITAPIPFRLRIGVTGHRFLPDPAEVSRKLREALGVGIRELSVPPVDPKKNRSCLVFTVLSSLAEGADLLVAEEILKMADAELEAVLPLALEDFLRDFSTAKAKSRFQKLQGRAGKTIVLRKASPDSGREDFREKAYEEAGRYVVDHCDLLIAVWNGKPARGRGGTAEVVAYARSIGRPLVIVPTEITEEVRVDKGSGISGWGHNRHAK